MYRVFGVCTECCHRRIRDAKNSYIYCDGRYPDYGFIENPHISYNDVVEVSDEELARFKAAEEAYIKYQTELKELSKRL